MVPSSEGNTQLSHTQTMLTHTHGNNFKESLENVKQMKKHLLSAGLSVVALCSGGTGCFHALNGEFVLSSVPVPHFSLSSPPPAQKFALPSQHLPHTPAKLDFPVKQEQQN